ncbi:MAG: hypothetical protein GY906_23090 [bacterium]|nr:hypothetical protein [bacterium]
MGLNLNDWFISPERGEAVRKWEEHLKNADPAIAVVTYTYSGPDDPDDLVHHKSGALFRHSKAYANGRWAFRRRLNNSPFSETT